MATMRHGTVYIPDTQRQSEQTRQTRQWQDQDEINSTPDDNDLLAVMDKFIRDTEMKPDEVSESIALKQVPFQ